MIAAKNVKPLRQHILEIEVIEKTKAKQKHRK
jgi:hypothetical protein